MKYKVDYAMCARADLKHLDYAIAQRIIKKIAFFAEISSKNSINACLEGWSSGVFSNTKKLKFNI